MAVFRAPLLSLLLLSFLVPTGCVPDGEDLTAPDGATASASAHRVNPGDQRLPPDLVVAPGSELEHRIEGECIPFFPWGDDRQVCVMSTPQNGTLGRLGPEDELVGGGDDVGGSSAALRDVPEDLPARVDHRAEYLDGCVTVSSQRACAWCVVHASTAMLEGLICSKGCDGVELSEPHLRSNSRGGDAFGSCAYGWNTMTALQTLVSAPIVDNATWPYVPNGRGMNNDRPSDDVLAMAAYRPTGYHTVDLHDLDAVKGELASGREILISVPVFIANYDAGSTRQDWEYDHPNVGAPPTEEPCSCHETSCMDGMCLDGYHSVLLTGYDDATQRFQFLNSWGKTWGDGGYGTMEYAFLTRYAYDGGALDDLDTTLPGNACEGMDATSDADADAGTGDMGSDGTSGTLSAAERCDAVSDCATCAALSGCGWCEGTGCQAASSACATTMDADTCPTTEDPCAVHTECGDCVAAEGCDWCGGYASACFSPALRTRSCGDVRNAPNQCSDCRMGTDCGSCAALEGCGWCPSPSGGTVEPASTAGSCVLGGEEDADNVSCGSYRGTELSCRPDECSRITNCGECLDHEGCGWCDGSDQCMPGGFWGPTDADGLGSTCGEDWDWFGIACDNTEAGCGEAVSCRECTRNGSEMCEWNTDTGTCGDAMMSTDPAIAHAESECPGACGEAYAMCESEADCCDGLSCVNNDCVDCGGAATVGIGCDPTVAGACCGTLVCSLAAGGGENTCCKSDTDNCADDSECCGEMLCLGGQCLCRARGESCQSGRECCGGSFCDGGVCT